MQKYQVTARKWRPQDFDQIIGQEHITTALVNAVNSGKIPHAYLFSGPRGVGKTSTARILAKILNCEKSPQVCGVCPACIEISTGQSLDVREIDGASNRGIEQIREIRDNAIYTPLSLKYKIFIIDEVHMLTKEASNALLKVLEEPPAHIIFMLATTEANKVLPTIRSRCQHYLLKRIPLDKIVAALENILIAENYTYEKEAIEIIANAGDGSMRDSQTILDQVILYTQGNLTTQQTREILGIPADVYFEGVLEGITHQNIVLVLEQLDAYLTEAGDGSSFAENLTKFLRQGLLIKKVPMGHPLLNISPDRYEKIKELFSVLSDDEMLILLNLSLDLCDLLRKETAERFWIESTLFKMLDYKNRIPLTQFRQEILKVVGREPKGGVLARVANAVSPQIQERAASRPSPSPQKGALSVAMEQNTPPPARIVPKPEEVSSPAPANPIPISSPEPLSTDIDDREGVLKNLFEIS
ncbi:MAG: DNA polymerase III subunit gamma/tau [Brevinema sp.]